MKANAQSTIKIAAVMLIFNMLHLKTGIAKITAV